MRAPTTPITANPAQGAADRAAQAATVAPSAGQAAAIAPKPGAKSRPGPDTAWIAGIIAIGAVLLLVAMRYGLAGVLGD